MLFNTRHIWCRGVLVYMGLLMPFSFAASSEFVSFDGQGVQQLMASLPEGKSLFLGQDDPNISDRFTFDFKARALAMGDGGWPYWRLTASPLRYASGGDGFSARLHLLTSPAAQAFTWKSQQGFLSTATGIHNQEFTVYVRVHELISPKTAQIALKIRGGGHHAREPDAASCSMMTFAPAVRKVVSRFGKELTHPVYDYVNLTARISTALEEDRWVGLKLLSWQDIGSANRVINQLYVDVGGLDHAGKPANRWEMLSEYVDIEEKSTGNYQKMVNWSGWQTTLRVDGYRTVDFAYPSLREIQVPQ